jgi:nucleoside-triphosphatase
MRSVVERSKLLLTGPPRIGKSTVVAGLVRLLEEQGVAVGGFVTFEQRAEGRRVGFVVRDIAGPEAVLAHEGFRGDVRVGRYGVDVSAFERVGLPAIQRALDERTVIVIDEIGRMELASEAFARLTEQVMRASVPVVATVPVRTHPFTDALKHRPGVEVVTVTGGNRDALPAMLLDRLVRV